MNQISNAYCYYSNFNLFENPTFLIRREKFIKQLLSTLGEEWRIYAGQSITIVLDGLTSHMAWQFCFENLLFTWFENEEATQADFMQKALQRIAPYTVDSIYFRPVCDGFYYSGQQLWAKMRLSRPPSTDQIKSLEQIKQEDVKQMPNFLKPLVLVSERFMKYFKTPAPQQQQQQQQQQFKQQPYPPQYQQQMYASDAEVKQEEQEEEIHSFKQISKLTENSLPLELVENAFLYASQFLEKSYSRCQVAKSFIVNIIEVNNELLNKFSTIQIHQQVKVRIMQPSEQVYDNLFSIWSLAMSNQSYLQLQQPQSVDLVGKTKALLGDNWKDAFQYPVELFFNTIYLIYQQIILNPNIRAEDQLKCLVFNLKHNLQEIWERDIVNKQYE